MMKVDNTDNIDIKDNIGNNYEKSMNLQILHRRNDLLMKSLQEAQNLNKNLLQIMKERANARRGITPQKKHPGYLVLSTGQYHQKYHCEIPFEEWKKNNPTTNIKLYRKYEIKTADVWRTLIQTPYDASIALQEIEHAVWRDFKEKSILAEMGLQERCGASDNGIYRSWIDDEGCERNGIYKWMFRADFRSGLWNVELYHTGPVYVPEEMRRFREIEKYAGTG